VVSNSAGSVTSGAATLTVLVPPTITSDPQSQTVMAGATTTFSVTASGSGSLSYQWLKNGSPVPGANTATLTLTNVQPASEGTYRVVVSNSAGSVTSGPATLTVTEPPLSVSLTPIADTTLFETSPDNNFGASIDLRAGTTAQGKKSRALLMFDVAGKLPTNAVVTNVTLVLKVTNIPGGGGATSIFGIHRVLAAWGEGSKDSAAASAGEASWVARLFLDSLWQAPGGSAGADYATAPSSTTSVAGLGPYTFGSTSNLVADVQSWVDGPAQNFGWLLATESENVLQTARRFGAREDATNRAELRIEFRLGNPAQALSFDSVERQGDQLQLRFTVPASYAVALEFAPSLPPPSWMVLTNIAAKLEEVHAVVPDVTSAASQRFYRLRVTDRIR